jgi:hypothetical protein
MELQHYNFLDTKLQAPGLSRHSLLFSGLSSQSWAFISLDFWKFFFSYLFSIKIVEFLPHHQIIKRNPGRAKAPL